MIKIIIIKLVIVKELGLKNNVMVIYIQRGSSIGVSFIITYEFIYLNNNALNINKHLIN